MPMCFKNSNKYLVIHKPRSKEIKHFLAPYNLLLNPWPSESHMPRGDPVLFFGSFPFLSSITTPVCIRNSEVFNF